MTENDILGISSYGDAAKTVISKTFDGVEAFLSATCKPALDELGMMARDKVRSWRLNNIARILERAKGKLEYKDGDIHLTANPKVALAIFDHGSNEEGNELQEMWAGLFASSLSEGGKDEENIIYVHLLRQLTLPQIRLLSAVVEKSNKFERKDNLLICSNIVLNSKQVGEITGMHDLNKQEVIIYHLNSLNLFSHHGADKEGFRSGSGDRSGFPIAYFRPSNLALNFYTRCLGKKSAQELFTFEKLPQ